ncbi:Na+/H+ antiporter NhaC [Arthrobacter stackebrandtii]|uniref:Na+/H+ antiporter NhaC n=1 Tax=Arthrobacter stackebrandtii TaxID=272161 RepID=A0ABS4YRT2_9MICC|nr:Na+/H+ antiporter NhaC family protein [Arthrobacter stackebrandtii]MBP2411504.1 Na+/H+ antiporter NhaC [Arthrobacter stackebrandtii]PYH00224.1 permease [Arthrobacter stackebrandtii]
MQTSTVPVGTAPKPKPWNSPANLVRAGLAVSGIVLALLVSPLVQATQGLPGGNPAALWGLLPIGLYAVLAFSGMSILASTLVALASALVLDVPTLPQAGDLLVGSLTNQVTIIGLIIALGAGVGGVLRETGVAQVIVAGVLRLVGQRGPRTVALGIMLACLVLVASLGTLAGALAIAAPLLIPVAARLGYTRISTATLMFIGGCAGLALAPFAGSNVAIMQAAEVGYGTYLLVGAGPLALLTLVVGMLWVPLVQRRSAKQGDFYSAAEAAEINTPITAVARKAAAIFAGLLAALVSVAIVTGIGIIFPLIALPILAIATGLGAKLPVRAWFAALGRGMWSMVGVFALFWLLAVLFLIIDRLQPFGTVLALLRPHLETSSPFIFSLIVALIGWVGVPGATAAQVVLIDKVFGPLAGEMGVGAGSWVVVLLFSSKADTYGPFPNPNMVGAMGLAHSKNLRMMLLTGWILLVPAALMYFLILFLGTR